VASRSALTCRTRGRTVWRSARATIRRTCRRSRRTRHQGRRHDPWRAQAREVCRGMTDVGSESTSQPSTTRRGVCRRVAGRRAVAGGERATVTRRLGGHDRDCSTGTDAMNSLRLPSPHRWWTPTNEATVVNRLWLAPRAARREVPQGQRRSGPLRCDLDHEATGEMRVP
jgi:hypothetical protein